MALTCYEIHKIHNEQQKHTSNNGWKQRCNECPEEAIISHSTSKIEEDARGTKEWRKSHKKQKTDAN